MPLLDNFPTRTHILEPTSGGFQQKTLYIALFSPYSFYWKREWMTRE